MQQVKVNRVLFNVKFTEDEFTNSFFSLKQDFLPTFQSKSDEYESCSINSEIKDHQFDIAKVDDQVTDACEEDDDMANYMREDNERSQIRVSHENKKLGDVVADSLKQIQKQLMLKVDLGWSW